MWYGLICTKSRCKSVLAPYNLKADRDWVVLESHVNLRHAITGESSNINVNYWDKDFDETSKGTIPKTTAEGVGGEFAYDFFPIELDKRGKSILSRD